MTKLTKDTPEWHQEWAKLVELLEGWKLAPHDQQLTVAIKESLEKVGLIVPVASATSDHH